MALKILPAGNVEPDGILSLKKIGESGLDGQEIEFVRQVYMNNETAKKIGDAARELGLTLSIHASYFVNLCSDEKKKIDDSVGRILLAAERGHHLGARNIVFHAGFYGKLPPEEAYSRVKEKILHMQDHIRKSAWDIVLCPETTGKKSQFGSLPELLRLMKETGCGICVDFSHLLARNGSIDYRATVESLPRSFHAHFSGIEYGDKGEKRHLLIDEKEFRMLAEELARQAKDVTIVCESPDPYGDAMKMKRIAKSALNI